MKISFMLNTFNSLKDAMVDALKTPDWWVYATLIAVFVLLITAIIIIVNCITGFGFIRSFYNLTIFND